MPPYGNTMASSHSDRMPRPDTTTIWSASSPAVTVRHRFCSTRDVNAYTLLGPSNSLNRNTLTESLNDVSDARKLTCAEPVPENSSWNDRLNELPSVVICVVLAAFQPSTNNFGCLNDELKPAVNCPGCAVVASVSNTAVYALLVVVNATGPPPPESVSNVSVGIG